jgi:hypothetical protein
MKMGFQFKIEEGVEVHRDPLGHYHHWTILAGKLVEGSIRRGDFVKVPLRDGTILVAYALDFIMFSRSLGTEVSTGQFDHPFGLMVWHPAPQQAQVALDIAADGTQEDSSRTLLDALKSHPERIFHNRGERAPHLDCRECTLEIPNNPEVRTMLEYLQTSTDTYIARRAALVLQQWAASPAELHQAKPRKTWFAFWHKK